MPNTNAVLLLAGAALLAIPAAAKNPKTAPDLPESGGSAKVNVIVQFKEQPTSRHHDKVLRLGGRGRQHEQALSLVRGGAYEISADKLANLASDPEVEYISVDREVQSSGLDYTRETIGSLTANTSGWTGKGIGVAVIDSGIFNLGDLPNPEYFESFVTGGVANNDLYGHGTHIAGIIAGKGTWSATTQYKIGGVAPGVRLVSLVALDNLGRGSDSSVIAAINKAIQLKSTYNIRVINLSLGRPVYESYTKDPLCKAVEAAWKAGIVVVVAAGNEGRNNSAGTRGYSTVMSPGNDPYVITVGAMKSRGTTSRSDDLVASYSSKGPTLLDQIAKPDIVAPGNLMVGAASANFAVLPTNYGGNYIPLSWYYGSGTVGTSSYYFQLSGTSMATGVVSGTVALMLQKSPSLTPDQVKARLMKTASKTFPTSSTAVDPSGKSYTSYYDLFTVGAGYLNATAALANTDMAAGSALSPKVKAVNGAYTLDFTNSMGLNIVWGTNLTWGTNIVWGTGTVSGTNVVVPTNIVWGVSGTTAYNLVWGTNIVWGVTSTVTGEAASVLTAGEN